MSREYGFIFLWTGSICLESLGWKKKISFILLLLVQHFLREVVHQGQVRGDHSVENWLCLGAGIWDPFCCSSCPKGRQTLGSGAQGHRAVTGQVLQPSPAQPPWVLPTQTTSCCPTRGCIFTRFGAVIARVNELSDD